MRTGGDSGPAVEPGDIDGSLLIVAIRYGSTEMPPDDSLRSRHMEQAGCACGETDEFGYHAPIDRVHMHDRHATMLHLSGVDHNRFMYRYACRDFRLTDVDGRVVDEVIARRRNRAGNGLAGGASKFLGNRRNGSCCCWSLSAWWRSHYLCLW